MPRSSVAQRAADKETVRGLMHLKQTEIAAKVGITLRRVSALVCQIKRETGEVNHLQQAKLIRQRVRQYLLTRPADTRQSAVGEALGITTDQARRAMLLVQDEVAEELRNGTATRKAPGNRMFWVDEDRLFSANREQQEVTL